MSQLQIHSYALHNESFGQLQDTNTMVVQKDYNETENLYNQVMS